MDAARTTQKMQFYCCVVQTTQKTSHVIAKHCWVVTSLRLRGSVFTEPLPRIELPCSIVTCVHYLETAVSVAQPFLLGANTPQYIAPD
jgi:hypothetical protein